MVDFPLLCLFLRGYVQFHHYDNWEHKHHTTHIYIYIYIVTVYIYIYIYPYNYKVVGKLILFNGVLNGFVAWRAHSH